MEETRWVRQVGDGRVYEGPCVLFEIILQPVGNGESVDVYDGRDATSGKLLTTIVAATTTTTHLSLGQGIKCDLGIYLDVGQTASIVTFGFKSLPWPE